MTLVSDGAARTAGWKSIFFLESLRLRGPRSERTYRPRHVNHTTRAVGFVAVLACAVAWTEGAGCGGKASGTNSNVDGSSGSSESGSGNGIDSGSDSGGLVEDSGDSGSSSRAGNPVTLASGRNQPWALALDSTYLYWTDDGSGAVMKVPLAGGSPFTLAAGQDGAADIAVDSASVYWTTYGGTVMSVCE
jgi:hypothetical protein